MENEDFERTLPPEFDHRESFVWWEKKRWIFNLAVGLPGLITAILFVSPLHVVEMVGAVMYGLLANLFYSLGSWLEMADAHYLGGALRLHRARMVIFLIGTIGSMLLTFGIAFLYALHPIMDFDD